MFLAKAKTHVFCSPAIFAQDNPRTTTTIMEPHLNLELVLDVEQDHLCHCPSPAPMEEAKDPAGFYPAGASSPARVD